MPELGPYGSVRGARGNSRLYRDPAPLATIQDMGPVGREVPISDMAMDLPEIEKNPGAKPRGFLKLAFQSERSSCFPRAFILPLDTTSMSGCRPVQHGVSSSKYPGELCG